IGIWEGGPAEAAPRLAGVPTLRRSTGGAGVLHAPGDLVWSVVLPRDHPAVGRNYARSYRRFGGPIADALAAAGIDAHWAAALDLSETFCLLGARGEVLLSAN